MTAANPSNEIEAILKRGIGLDARSIGSSLVNSSIRARMKKRGIKNIEEYAELLGTSEVEFQALVEEVIVPETWFFRDPQAFALLGEWASHEWLPSHSYETLRILSMPCASGEEPYSIVMALLDAGLSTERFSVEAVDISAVALEKARRASYGRNAFRGQATEYRDRYFKKSGESWRLSEAICRQVQFRQMNVLDSSFGRKDGETDVIFCRNMMIYFDEASRARLMTRLGAMLAPDGLLFLGHAEGGLAREFGFEPVPRSMAFAFRKSKPESAKEPNSKRRKTSEPPKTLPKFPASVVPKLLPPLPQKPASVPIQPRAKTKQKTEPAGSSSAEPMETVLLRAQKWADEGRFDQARTECENCLQAHGPSSRVYYLLGLIDDAAGNVTKAEEYYKKTLYMEPDNSEALFQLSLLAKKNGDAKAARQLNERARRAQAKATLKAS